MTLRSLRQDFALILVSLALSLSLWLYVQSIESLKVSKTIRVPLYVSGVPEEMVPVNVPELIRATLRGNPADIEKINFENVRPRASVDLGRAEPGVNAYRVYFDLPAELAKFEWDFERQVEIRIEAKKTSLRPVKLETIGGGPAGSEFQFAVEPDRVRIEGAESYVGKVAQVLVKLNIANLQSGVANPLVVEVYDSTGLRVQNLTVTPSSIQVIPTLAPLAPQRNVLITPSFSGQPEFGFQVIDFEVRPNQVTLTGDDRTLQGVKTVSTEPVELAGLRSDATRIVSLRIPKGLQSAAGRRVSVFVRVRPTPPRPGPPGSP